MKFDLIVIGSGPAGQKAAMHAAHAGKKVAIVEGGKDLGGGCTHYGTLPSKSFRESVYRWSLGSQKKHTLPDMNRLMRRAQQVIEVEVEVVRDQLKRNGVRVFKGMARFKDSQTLEIEGGNRKKTIQADTVFIAVGARPVAPAHLRVDGTRIHDSNTILDVKHLPKHLVVLGAGIIGCEYASMFLSAGSYVTLVDKRNEILASVDRELTAALVQRFESQGLKLITGAEAVSLTAIRGSAVNLELSNGKKLHPDMVLIALGRQGNTESLGLEHIGIQVDARGLIRVNTHFQTDIPHIYAIGDVIGAPALASTSMEQGRMAACHAFGMECELSLPSLYPYGIYTIPEISMIGETEEQLRGKKVDFVVGHAPYREIARGLIVGDQYGLLKLCVDRKTRKLLGVHILGDNAADLIHIGQAVMTFGGDLHYFIRNVFNYPTLAEAYKTAALSALNQIEGK